MKSTPFKRAIMMSQAIAVALSAGMPPNLAMASVGEYHSRGKGLGRYSGKKWGPAPSSKYAGITNGKRECARRMHQVKRGMITVSNGLVPSNMAV